MAVPRSRHLRHLAQIIAGERKVTAAAKRALMVLLQEAARALASAGYDTAVLDSRFPGWRAALDKDVVPTIERVFTDAWAAADRGAVDPQVYATRHLEAVWNRLVGVSDEVFDVMRLQLEEGRQAGESIPQLAQRVDALLADGQRWTNRAVAIARTEVIAANNMGAAGSAGATAEVLGVDPALVVKEWMSTEDSRTRPTHRHADGQQVMGLDAKFSVGKAELLVPGDPRGRPEETIQCRCTVIFIYPGDPEYPSSLAPGRGSPADVVPIRPAPAAAPAAAAAEAAPPPAARIIEPVIDTGPRNDIERMARSLTLQELEKETRRGSAKAKAAARAELKRRGLAASAALTAAPPTQEDPVTTTAPETETPDEHTSVVVVALPAAGDAVHDIGPEQKHATVLFFGDIAGTGDDANEALVPDFRTLLSEVCAVVADNAAPFTEDVTGVESLGDDGARVWMLAGSTLPALRDALLDVDSEVVSALGNVEQYPSYTPHVTIGYPEDEGRPPSADGPDGPSVEEGGEPSTLTSETEAAAAAVSSITFDRIAVWWAGEQTEWSLTGGQEQETPVDTDIEAALAVVRTAGYAVQLTAADEAPETPLVEAPPVPTEGPEAASDIPTGGAPFYGIIWPENVVSGDGRAVESGATTWRDLPLPIMAQESTAPGHDGALRVGRLDSIERDTETYSVPVIRYAGVWDVSEAAVETARQVGEQMVRGISVDGDAVTVELRGSDGVSLDPMSDEFPEDGVVLEVATAARVSGGTVCSIPAFHQAYIANGSLADRTDPEPGWNEDGTPKDNTVDGGPAGVPVDDEEPALVASAWTLTAAVSMPTVPAAAFTRPAALDDNPAGTPLTVTADGRVFGHLATWGTCHIGIDGLCQEPPASPSNYAYYATGAVTCDDGTTVPVGPLTMETGHAALQLGHRAAASHYDNTGTVVADVTMGQDHIGIWFSGMIRPGTTEAQVYGLRAAGKVSGDWRNIAGSLELVAALVVNTPGFPMPRPALAASAAHGAEAMVAAGIVQTVRPRETNTDVQAVAAAVVATLDRRDRARAVAARLQTQRATVRQRRAVAAAARLNTTLKGR